MSEFVPARPVMPADGPYGGRTAFFYPLQYPACPSATTTKGAMIISRIMRGKGIQILMEPYRMQQADPTLVFCRECTLGLVAARRHVVVVKCPHRTWSRATDPKVTTAQRLGTNIGVCSICARTYRTNPDVWEYVGEDPPFYKLLPCCGDACRDRAMRMPLLT